MTERAMLVPMRPGFSLQSFGHAIKSCAVAMRAGMPTFEQFLRPSIEYTGFGNQLCFEGYGGRWFRSSEERVRDAVDIFCMELANGNYINFNDLYANLGIEQTHFGAQWGYSPDVDSGWGYSTIRFDVTLVDDLDHELVRKMGESILIIEPDFDCYPIECYLEV